MSATRERDPASISRSLAPLRDVVASIARAGTDGDLPPAADRQRMLRRVRAAGSAALPSLLRALVSERHGEGVWAAWLLERVSDEERPRLGERLSRLLEDPRLDGEARDRVDGLLRRLFGDAAGSPTGRKLAVFVDELLRSLDDQEDVALAAQLVAENVADEDVPAFVAEIVGHGGTQAAPLLDKLIEAGLQSPPTLTRLRNLRTRLDDDHPDPCERRTRRRPEAAPSTPPGSSSRITHRGAQRATARRAAEPAPDIDPRTRGMALLADGEIEEARVALERAIARFGEDGELLSHLGVCLLRLGEPALALVRLERATELEPDEALHHWNLAAAAKAADRSALGYVALARYLALPDEQSGCSARRREARRYLRACERWIDAMHPGVPLDQVVRGEALFARAFGLLGERRFDEAAQAFREVVALLPAHYPSWGNLGVAEIGLGRLDEARESLSRALAIKPDYDAARENLALLDAQA